MSNSLKGTIYKIEDVVVVSDKFKKRNFIIFESYTTQNGYEIQNYISLQVTQDKVDELNNFKAKDKVEVSYNLQGRLWTNKEGVEMCFNTLTAWKIEKLVNENISAEPTNNQPESTTNSEGEQNDLPF